MACLWFLKNLLNFLYLLFGILPGKGYCTLIMTLQHHFLSLSYSHDSFLDTIFKFVCSFLVTRCQVSIRGISWEYFALLSILVYFSFPATKVHDYKIISLNHLQWHCIKQRLQILAFNFNTATVSLNISIWKRLHSILFLSYNLPGLLI